MSLLHPDTDMTLVRNVGIIAGQQILNVAVVTAEGPVPYHRAPQQVPRDDRDWHMINVHLTSPGTPVRRAHASDDLRHFMMRDRSRIEGVIRRWRHEDEEDAIWEQYDAALDDLGQLWGQEFWLPRAWLAPRDVPAIFTHINIPHGVVADWVVASWGHVMCFDREHPRVCNGSRHGVEPHLDGDAA